MAIFDTSVLDSSWFYVIHLMVNNVADRSKQQCLIVSLMYESSDSCLFGNAVIVRHLGELLGMGRIQDFRTKTVNRSRDPLPLPHAQQS